MLADEFKKRAVMVNGTLHVKYTTATGIVRASSLALMSERHRRAWMEFSLVGAGNARYGFEVVVFHRHRPLKQQVYISLVDVYKFFKLTCYKGFPSRWISRSRETRHKCLIGVFGDGADHFIIDKTWSKTDIDMNLEHLPPGEMRCLPCASGPVFAIAMSNVCELWMNHVSATRG